MPSLKNQRHEKFVQAYFRNPNNQSAAYRKAGYTAKKAAAHAAASRLLKSVKVQKRLAELNKLVERTSVMDRQEALELATQIARSANLVNFIDKNGNAFSLSELKDPDVAIAIGEVTVTIGRGNIPVKRFKLRDPLHALEFVAKMEGWMAPEKHQHAPMKVEDMTDEELESLATD